MTTKATIARKLRNRVADLDALQIKTARPFVFRVEVSSKTGRAFEDLKKDIVPVLDAESNSRVLFEIAPYQGENSLAVSKLQPELALACYACDQTDEGVGRALVDVVHDLAKVFIEPGPDKGLMILVAQEDGSAPPEFLERVRLAAGEICFAGMPFQVAPVDPRNPHHLSMARAGFPVPSRAARVVQYTEEDEHRYVGRIRNLLAGRSDAVSQLVSQGPSRLFVTLGSGVLEVGALLPLYGQVFVEMPQRAAGGDYFRDEFGLPREDFLTLCRAGAVVPIFGHNLGLYPEAVWRTWLEDPSLPMLSPRDIDFVAMKYLWETSSHLREIRDDPDALRSLDRSMSYLLANGDRYRANRWIYEYFDWIKMGAEQFEGLAFHRGRLNLANLSAGGALAHNIALLDEKLFTSKAVAQTVAIDAFGSSQNLATAHALGASLCDGMVSNDGVLVEVARMFQEAVEVKGRLQTRQLAEVVKSLELHHSDRIPIREYLDVMSGREVERIRSIIQDVHSDLSPRDKILELRERIQELNREVALIDRRALNITTADVMGDAASGLGAGSGGTAYGLAIVAKLLGGAVAKEIGTRGVDATLDGRLGSEIDRVRGMLNGVSGHAIRVYRIRKKLRH